MCSDFPVEVSLPEQVGSSGAVTFDIHCPPGGGDVYLPIMQRTSLGENAHPEYYPMRHSLPLEVNTPLSYTVDTDDDVSGSSICVYVIEPTRSQYDDILGSLDASDQLLSIPDSIQRVSAQECTRRQ